MPGDGTACGPGADPAAKPLYLSGLSSSESDNSDPQTRHKRQADSLSSTLISAVRVRVTLIRRGRLVAGDGLNVILTLDLAKLGPVDLHH